MKIARAMQGRVQWFWPHSKEHLEVRKRKALSIVSPVHQCRFSSPLDPYRICRAGSGFNFRSSVRLPDVSRADCFSAAPDYVLARG